MRKTVKSKVMDMLEDSSDKSNPESITSEVLLIDAMAIIQALKNPSKTFGKLATQIFNTIMAIAAKFNSTRVDFIGDRYPDVSIKGAERKKRAVGDGPVFAIVSESQKVPSDWKKFLSVGKNKEHLLSFLSEQWRRIKPKDFPNDIKFLISESFNCFSVTKIESQISIENVESLSCDHEEADTRLLLHAKHAADEGYTNAVIRTPDTDVVVMLVGLEDQIANHLFVETGTGNRWRIVDINEVASSLPPGASQALIGFHALTGKKLLYYLEYLDGLSMAFHLCEQSNPFFHYFELSLF